MKIEPFGVEQWMNAWETRCELNLAETCVHSLTIGELLEIAGRTGTLEEELAGLPLTYGPITGSERLRGLVAGLHERRTAENVLICHGTIGANQLVYQALVGPGDKVVSITPTYQQHTAIPEALGAELVELQLRPEDGWLPDLDRLREAMAGGARLLTFTNPNNPTGSLMPPEMLDEIVAIAREADAWILSDEVYRGAEPGPSVADLYEKGIATGGMSKIFGLAGLRLGWIVAPTEILRLAELHRDYSTISVGRVDDHLASLALEHRQALIDRARRVTRGRRAQMADWIEATPRVGWVPPQAGTVALITYPGETPSRPLAERLLAETGVLLTPGSVMGVEGTLRVGYAQPEEVMTEGLARLGPVLSAL
ncbi:aminotransferase class I/II-fold pyridoxal phosphate-dependent enzyme [Histidinibacterium aquaticum]|uniref:Aminotransferase n=1 Tax=Histidinibacterium aquaticum TaxID=2613962 RepID=A0A5J5GCU2_9RHOB|nr:aminotransferase class I/II-fold pyridoxal phosphate-dependent enzyme [Histidinibacterium aquaticum]KAA9005999.1 aminotransferase class I/II-fold pyridoxal phosphate-dependent enzyme [Histidinibacterium aquaticum]